MKVKCEVSNHFTDKLFNSAKRGAEKANVDSYQKFISVCNKLAYTDLKG